ncbi:hypothetical protein OS493_022943, partial [Desmophyllum pertusum]
TFSENSETTRDEFLASEQNRLDNLVFGPFQGQQEVDDNNVSDVNFSDINVSDPRTSYYSTKEFNSVVNSYQVKSTTPILLASKYKEALGNKFDSLLTYLNSLNHEFSVIKL